MRIFLVIVVALLLAGGVRSAEMHWSTRLEGSSISGGQLSLQDGFYSWLGTGYLVDINDQSFLRLGLKEDQSGLFYNGHTMRVSVVARITTYNNTGGVLSTFDETLEVVYSASGAEGLTVDAEDYRIPGVHKIKAVVQSVSMFDVTANAAYTGAVPNYLYLEAGFSSTRYFLFGDDQTPDARHNYITYQNSGASATSYTPASATTASTHEIELTWDYIGGAEYYDVEWTWVDCYDIAGISSVRPASDITLTEQEFSRNSTRIRTSGHSYRLPQVFGRGYLIYRVRGVGRWLDAVEKDKYGLWSSGTNVKANVSDWPDIVQIGVEHEQGIKNWQYQSTYAEEGKKKEVVQYFDGSLRGRQTVTRINSDNKSVVGETVYDNEGRGSVQVLPVPQANPAIKYYPSLNKNTGGVPYSHKDFDWEQANADDCNIAVAGALSDTAGAGKYYSTAAHTTDTDWQAHVPDAEGYAFTQVEYTPDNTGRIRSQSGVGTTHKTGSGKETTYYYSQPTQEELNRLFGYKAGYKSRYKKNMVVDANGQVSISYLDAQGRVIATAMAGENPSNLEGLGSESAPNHLRVSNDLINKTDQADTDTPSDDNTAFSTGRFGTANDGLRLGIQLAVVENGSLYDFEYKVKSGHYQAADCGTSAGPTFPYVYDLTLSIKDNCGREIASQTSYQVGIQQIGSTVGDLKTIVMNGISLDQGSYTLFKEIKVNEAALQAYLDHYLDPELNPCVLDNSDFLAETSTDCNTGCDECAAGLGTLPAFLEAQRTALDVENLTPEQVTAITNLYNTLLKACKEPCTVKSSCDAYEGLLRSDMRPLGQYGGTAPGDPLSIFNTSGGLSGNWKTPAIPYADENGNPFLLDIQYDGTSFSPPLAVGAVTYPAVVAGQQMTVQTAPQSLLYASDFIAAWQDSWSLSLFQYHPEYKLYEYQSQICSQQAPAGNTSLSSDLFDAFFRDNIDTYEKARGTNLYNIDFTDETSGRTIMFTDPYFTQTYGVHSTYTSLKNNLMNEAISTNYAGSGMPMLSLAVRTVICGTDLSGSCSISSYDTWAEIASTGLLSADQKNEIWTQYKSHYLSFKLKINQLLMDFHGFAQSPGLYNSCIGNGEFNMDFASAFAHSAYASTTISAAWASLWNFTFPAFANPPVALCGGDYNSKQIRMVRIENLYNPGLPPSAVIAEASATADYAQWQQTGLCAVAADMERLLDKLGRTGKMLTVTSSNALPELTRDLYEHLTGMNTSPTAVTVSGAVSGTSLELKIGNGVNECKTYIPQVGPYTWNTYPSGWKIWGIYHSYPHIGTNEVDVVIKAGPLEATAVEYVVTYQTCEKMNTCQEDYAASNALDPSCDKEERLENGILKVLRKALSAGQLQGTFALNTSPEYMQGILTDYLGTSSPSWNGTGGASLIQDGTNSFSLGIAFPANTTAISSVDLVGNTLYVKIFAGASNTPQTFLSTINYTQNGKSDSPIDLSCPCDAAKGLPLIAKELVNHLLQFSGVPGGYKPAVLARLTPYITAEDPAIYGFLSNAQGISFSLGENGGCPVMLSGTVTGTLIAVSNIAAGAGNTFTATGHLLSGATITLSGSIGCLKASPGKFCNTCLPAIVPPLSCNELYNEYELAVSAITNASFVPVTEADFCASGYAYITDAYGMYLSMFGVTATNQEHYLSIAAFGSTPVGYSSSALAEAVEDYHDYWQITTEVPRKTWNQYVTKEYMKSRGICPVINPPVGFPDIEITYPCDQWQNQVNVVNAANQEQIYRGQLAAAFRQSYIERAMGSLVETFSESHADKEYHYTLYYYDRGGNLIQTVPPKGVDRLEAGESNTLTNSQIDLLRAGNPEAVLNTDGTTKQAPEHTLETIYRYNSLNQLVFQQTPDGGESRFAYDVLGRIAVSQNAKQRAGNRFSYTLYDFLGRVTEAGEFTGLANYSINATGRLVLSAAPATEVNVSSAGWITAVTTNAGRREVTMSVYDQLTGITVMQNGTPAAATGLFGAYSPTNTRNRIVATLYQEQYNPVFAGHYDALTLYDYDEHGNVKELIQVNTDAALVAKGHHVKKLLYVYDLVSGNVKQVTYQKGRQDQFIHRYLYDADNRITQVETSSDGNYFEKDAKYFYYAHGPLARTEIGNKKVQAQDHAYTIQGWLKAVNGEELTSTALMGGDGRTGTANSQVARDAYGYSLGYYDNDYKAAASGMLAYSKNAGQASNQGTALYNGNIRTMYTALSNTTENSNASALSTHQSVYTYDQLNRIKSMQGFNLTLSGTTLTRNASGYSSAYGYDENGNLKAMSNHARDAAGAPVWMDDFSYSYKSVNGTEINQLDHVADTRAAGLFSMDVDNQDAGNYTYDAIGQLTRDEQEGIANIAWTVTNKVKEVSYTSGKKIAFRYNAMGQRIAKLVTEAGVLVENTHYYLDAQGNPMAVYEIRPDAGTPSQLNLYLAERSIYGASRIGMEMGSATVLANETWAALPATSSYYQQIGDKRFELANHLGNVLNVVTDRKLPQGSSGNVAYYTPDVVSYSDYYPFGMQLPNRRTDYATASDIDYADQGYRYGFQGQEKDDEIKGEGNSVNYEYRMHDPRIGRFFAVDPLSKEYPFYSPYVFSGNQVIHMVELEGLEPASRGNAGVYLGLRMSGEKHTDAQKVIDDMVEAERKAIAPLAISSAITSAFIVDAVVTKGWMSRIIWGAALGQQMNSTDNYHDAMARGDYAAAAKYNQEMKATGPIAVWGAFFEVLGPLTISAKRPSSITTTAAIVETPYGAAVQSTTTEALAVRSQIESGGKLYRIGTTGKSQASEAQFWATENPLANPQAFAKKYGIPKENIENANFIEVGTLKPGTNFITRPAPAAPGNPAGYGGGIEVVTPANGVTLESFSTIN